MAVNRTKLNLGNLKTIIMESGVWEHLDELRKRLTWAVIGLIITVVISFVFAQQILEILAQPAGGLDALQAIQVTETISAFMRISLISGVILALPWILYQLLAFVMPGLEDNEKRWIYFGIPAVTVLFLSGVAFTYYIMLPTAIPVLLTFMGVQTVPQVSDYVNFVTGLMFWVGVAFQTPVVAFILAKLKIIRSTDLSKQWRFAIVGIALAAAVITPTGDPINMGLLMIPLTALYGLSIFLTWLARRNEDE
ncbi:MAG: twin-arginine translocase subunit TatC [Anaerolineae bacterium]|jgi:sec-independent protein translocase protein TatC|nr:twin-arginine translocase subunit TatC [Anaerolineae bacterium]